MSMLGQKFSKNGLVNVFHRTKNMIGHAYHRAKAFLGDVDHGFSIAKKVYGAVAPILSQVNGGNQINKHIMNAVGGYEGIRNKVMDAHDTAINNVNQVASNLKKANVKVHF